MKTNYNQINRFLRNHQEGYQFSCQTLSAELRIPEAQVRRYIRVLKETEYILQVGSNNYYRVYIATPKFLDRNVRVATILRKYKALAQRQSKESRTSNNFCRKIKEQTKEIQELKHMLAELKDEINEKRVNSNQLTQGTLLNGGQ